MGSSRHTKIGKHYLAGAHGNQLRKEGKSPEEIRKILSETQERQKEWEKENKGVSVDISRVKAEGKKEEEIKEVEAHSPPGTIAKRREEKKADNLERAKEIMRNLRPGKVDNGFYGHVVQSDFKRTSIISTSGRVR